MTMYAEERQQAMAQLVAERGRLSVNVLAEEYDVTLLPKVSIDVVVADDVVEEVIQAIVRAARTAVERSSGEILMPSALPPRCRFERNSPGAA